MLSKRLFLKYVITLILFSRKSFAFLPLLARIFIRSAPRTVIRSAIRSRIRSKKTKTIKKEIKDEFITQAIEELIKKGLKDNYNKININYSKKKDINYIIKKYNLDAIWVKNYNKELKISIQNKSNQKICGSLSILIQDFNSKKIEFESIFGKICAEANANTNLKLTFDSKKIKINEGIKIVIFKGPYGLKYISKPILVI